MKKLKLIYNPGAGDRSFKNTIDDCLSIFQSKGFDVHIFRSMKKDDVGNHILTLKQNEYDTIVVCGGDGTINMAVNAIMEKGIKSKIGVIPAGTANDFASFLNIPKDYVKAAEIIAQGETMGVDLGKANDRYFINVCGAGFLTNISQHIDEDFKNTLGKMAYYIKGVEQIQNFVPMPVRITNSKEIIDADIYFLIVLNSAGAGSFANLAPSARIDDGLFDFLAIKEMPVTDIARLIISVFRGEHLDDENVIFFQDSFINIESTHENPDESLLETDVDGELGPFLPVKIVNLPRAIEVYYNRG